MKIGIWNIRFFKQFFDDFYILTREVEALEKKAPTEYKHHPKTKLLAHIINSVFKAVPQNPNHPNYKLGNTLGPKGRSYKRVKYEMPPRYRLFFRFFSEKDSIIYLWFNDEFTLRKHGSKTDVYIVFRKMIENNDIPKRYEGLIKQSKVPKKTSATCAMPEN